MRHCLVQSSHPFIGIVISPLFYFFSSLRSLIEKPPIGGKDLIQLSVHQLQGFRLHAGPVSALVFCSRCFVYFSGAACKSIGHVVLQLPDQYRLMSQQPLKRKHKHKKQKLKPGDTPLQETPDASLEGSHEKKHKKQKRHDEEKERKKKKKEKKKKKVCPIRGHSRIIYAIIGQR